MEFKQILTMLTLAFSTVTAFAGPESGGGGNICRVSRGLLKSEWRALDIANAKSIAHAVRISFLAKDQIRFDRGDLHDDFKTDLKVVTPSHQTMAGIDVVLSDLRAKGASKTADEIYQSIADLKMLATTRLPGHRPLGADFTDFAKDHLCSPANTQAVILYDWQIGIVIAREVWNQLAALDQITLLLHEGLRNIQIRYRHGFSDLTLQRMTSALLSGDTAAFLRLYKAGPATTSALFKAAQTRLCKPKSLEIAETMDTYSQQAGASLVSKQSDLFLKPYLTAACRPSAGPLETWKLLDFVQKNVDSQIGWSGWGLKASDFEELNRSILLAYGASYGVEIKNPDQVWNFMVAWRRVDLDLILSKDSQMPQDFELLNAFKAHMNETYKKLAQ